MSGIIDDAKRIVSDMGAVFDRCSRQGAIPCAAVTGIEGTKLSLALDYAEGLETRVKNLENRLEGSGHALESERIKREWLMDNNEQWQARAEEAEAQIKKLSGQNKTLEYNMRDVMTSRDSWKDRAEEAESKGRALEKAVAGQCYYCAYSNSDIRDLPCRTCRSGKNDAWEFDYDRFKEGEHERDN